MDAGKTTSELPVEVEAYIDEVAQRIRGRKTREQVRRELAARFTEALADCPTPQERQACGAALLVSWGEAPQVARRIRRDRKRARPLWKKALIRTAQVVAVWLTVVGIRYLSLSVGSPEVRVDYLQMLEELNRQGHPPEDNAYPYYQEAWEIIAAAASDMVEQIRQEKAAQSGDAQEEDQDEWQPRFTIIGPDGKPQDVPV